MPRKTNDLIKEEQIHKKSTAKKTKINAKKTTAPTSSITNNIETNDNSVDSNYSKKDVNKNALSNKNANSKKSSSSKDTTAKNDSKKSTNTKKNTTKRTTKKTKDTKKTKNKISKTTNRTKNVNSKNTKSKTSKTVDIIEYYDLPYRYNQTVVKILAQTPTTLFVYWDISDSDREKYVEQYGKHFFENTIPVLIVHNKTMNYSFEIEINDFANSWYFNVNDAKCEYEIELGRRAKPATITIPNNYMYVASSNTIEAPNNHILFEKNQKTLFFRNIKTNNTFSKNVSHFEFIKYIGRIYNIYDVYKKIYKNEELQDLEHNPTSKF